MGGTRDPVWRKTRYPVEAPQSEGDFYMATFRDGRIRKVGCKMKDGPPLRVRRVLDFNSKAERAKEQALTLKRKELGTGCELQAQALGRKEMTLAEVMLEMKRKRAEEGLATVQRQAPSSSKQVTSTSKRTPVAQIAAVEEIAEETPVESETPPVVEEEEMHVTEDNPPQKKRKRKSTSKQPEVQVSSPVPSSPEASTASDNLTLAEWLKKSVASTMALVATEDAGIRVFQRRMVKSKALRRRPSKAEPAEDERPPSPVTVCENPCDCDECMPNDTAAPKSARNALRLTRCPRMEASIISIDAENREELSTHETREAEFEVLPLPEITPADPVFHETEIEEQFLEAFCPEAVAEEKPLIIEVPAPSSDVSSPGLENFPEATPELPDCDMSDVVNSSETRPQVVEEISPAGDIGQGSAVLPESSSYSITSMELEYTENRIDALLDTLVTPDELLPVHLSASKSNKKTNKKKSLCETVTLDPVTTNEGPASNPIFQKQEENLAEQISLNLRERILKSVTVSFPSPSSDPMEETQGSRVQPTEVVDPQPTVDLTSSMMEVPTIEGEELLDEAQYVSKEHGHAPESVASFNESEAPTPMDYVANREAILPEEPLPNAEEQSDTLMVVSDVVEVTGTPPSSPVKSLEDAVYNEDPAINVDASDRDLGAASTSTSKALFTNLSSDGLSKRNRKSFSPNSRLKLIEAARTEGSTPTFRIKLMKSKMGDGYRKRVKSRKAIVLQDQDIVSEDASAQESFQPESEQIASPVPHPAENGSPERIMPDSSTRPGSPEYQKEQSEPLQTHPVSTPDKSVVDLTEGCLSINIECRPDSPSGFCTPNAKGDSPLQPKSILKTRSVDPDTRCRGVCRCPRCISTRDQSEAARDFIKSQMIMANNITTKLISELRNMRATVEEGDATPSCQTPSEKAKEALESATKAETWATKEILKLSRDSKRVCRLIETGPRRTIFADDAGKQLCHVKFLPAKKNTFVNF